MSVLDFGKAFDYMIADFLYPLPLETLCQYGELMHELAYKYS